MRARTSAEQCLGIDIVELGGLHQGVDDGGALAAAIGPAEQPGLATEGVAAQRALGSVVVRQDGPRRMDTALDADGNNLLIFEEWAVSTVDRLAKADADGNARLTPREFSTTAP